MIPMARIGRSNPSSMIDVGFQPSSLSAREVRSYNPMIPIARLGRRSDNKVGLPMIPFARIGRSQINNAMIPMARIGRSKISSSMIPMARIGRSGSGEEMLPVFLPTDDFPGRDLKFLP